MAIAFLSLLALLLWYLWPANAASSRYSWVVSEIYNFNHPYKAQLPQELATKMQRMSTNAFAFYRGTAHLFYKDMTTLPASSFVNSSTNYVWLEGDMHLQNMGAFRDSSDNDIFDVTDFDEAYLGSYTWDLRRMAVSIMLAAKANGIGSSDRQDVVRSFLDAYFDKIKDFKGTNDELSYRLNTGNTSGYVKDLIQGVAGESRSSFLSKYTTVNASGSRLFKVTPGELEYVSSSTSSSILAAMTGYVNSIPSSKRYSSSYYTVKDIRLKLGSGIGSLGKYRYYVLIEGPSASTSDDVILQMKQESSSAVAIAAPGRLPASQYGYHEGQRVTISTKAMLTNTDVLLGYATISGVPYMVREKSPYQVDFDYTQLTSKSKFTDAVTYMGKAMAKDHALADKDYNAAIVSYSQDKEVTDIVDGNRGTFKDEMIAFTLDYTTQVENDYNSFLSAYQSGTTLY
ncbi:hypothetical protein DO97_18680 [Neosynechococcus sphagnicola sy1]|uniref:DUF2252 domain-containing protein n=1 Tax=Neosynechococcus sphagnicola sy1 TaxID=1497020 RepID=A0A098TRU2_9CYAN|nr:hypothetical protein DO97_18680 [Neosynechococcus sphagnicola sy1]